MIEIDDKHKQVIDFSYVDDFQPKIDRESFVAPNATVAGNVEVRVSLGKCSCDRRDEFRVYML